MRSSTRRTALSRRALLLGSTAAAAVAATGAPASAHQVRTTPIFHRGHVANGREENTLPAFAAAVALGGGIELDLHETADGFVVVHHDDTWDRMTPMSGLVSATLFADADGYVTDGGNDIPSFAQANAVTMATGPVLLDMKGEWTTPGLQSVEATLADTGALGHAYLFHDDPIFLARVAADAPQVKRVLRTTQKFTVGQLTGTGCRGVLASAALLDAGKVARLHEAGLRVFVSVYSVRSRRQLAAVTDLGVNGVVIDAADWTAWH